MPAVRMKLCAAIARILLLAGLGSQAANADSAVTNCDPVSLAGAVAAGGIVSFTQDCSMTFTSTISISGNVTVDGLGHKVSLSGNNTVRLFSVQPGASLALRNLTLTAGRGTNGGALYVPSGGSVVISNCLLAGNVAQGSSGSNGADAQEEDPQPNTGREGGRGTAGSPAYGGAIWNDGILTILNSTFLTNATLGGSGGLGGNGSSGVYRGGRGAPGGKAAPAFGGAIWNGGTIVARDSTFSGNAVLGGSGAEGGAPGGGLFDSRAGTGSAGGAGSGGAIYSTQSLAVVGCTFDANSAAGGSGSLAGTAYSGNGATGPRGGDATGAGVANTGSANFTNCTFFENTATGGAGGTGGNGTIAGRGGQGGGGTGGGIWNSRTTIAVNCTFASGGALGGDNGGPGEGADPRAQSGKGASRGGALANRAGKLLLLNTLLADSPTGNNTYGKLADGGYNLSSDKTPSFKGTSKRKIELKLDTLADNGGPTKTVGLLLDSPARNAATNAFFPPTDQRGVPRPAEGLADLGAFEISPPAFLTQPQSLTRTNGDSAVFSFTAIIQPPAQYQWLFNGTNMPGATNASLNFASVTFSNAGSYIVQVSTGLGSVTSAPALLTIVGPPVITTQPQSQTNLAGSLVTFSVAATGLPAPSFQWWFNATNLLVGATATNLTLNPVRTNDAGNYSVVVSNSLGSVTSAVAALTVWVPPTITTQPQSQVASPGTQAGFSVQASGTAPLSYQWQFNGTNLPGATLTNLVFSNVQASNAGTYTVIIANVAGSVTSAPATLAVSGLFILVQPSDTFAVTNHPARFELTAGGIAPISSYWRFNDTDLPATHDTVTNSGPIASIVLSITNGHVQLAHAGLYTAVLSNAVGVITSAPARLRVSGGATISSIGRGASNFSFAFPVQTGFSYLVQYTTNLNDSNWLPLGTSFPGFDGTWTNQDFNATNASRFYRVLVQ